jgi:hypothetical protein
MPAFLSVLTGARSGVLSLAAACLLCAPAHAQPVQWSGNEHFYELVLVPPQGGFGVQWDVARAGALAHQFGGHAGYLVTITSAGENTFLAAQYPSSATFTGAWTGGNEPGNDGHWRWADGPESGQEYWDQNTHTATPYANWGGVEPNNQGAEENYMAYYLGPEFQGFGRGAWYDSPRNPPFASDPQVGYIVEYSGCGAADVGSQGGVTGGDGHLDNNDFVVFINAFFNQLPLADRGVQGGLAGSDGHWDNNDFVVFINEFFAGCE